MNQATASTAGAALSAFALAVLFLGAPGLTHAGPGCMSDPRLVRGFHPHGPMMPYAGYGPMGPAAVSPVTRPPLRQAMTAGYGPVAMAATAPAVERPAPAAARGETPAAAGDVTVRINGMRFEPARITVRPGTTVTWVQESGMPHIVAGNDAGMRSSTLSSGQTFSHTFDSQGLYNYFCALHPSMTGSVVVEEPGQGS